MPTTSPRLNKAGILVATAFIAMMLNPAVSTAKNTKDPAANGPAASQMIKLRAGGTGPGRPALGGSKMVAQPGQPSTASWGCHDGASRTSYEGPCDYHEEHEATGGCQSDITRSSYPGNCANSSEP